MSLESIPNGKEIAPLRMIESTATGGNPEDVTKHVHADNVRIALQAAELFGLEAAGIDIISMDIKKPWYVNGAIINEVNYLPVLGGYPVTLPYVCPFLEQIISGDGRIPVEAVVGGDEAMQEAENLQKSFIDKGAACFLTSHKVTLSPGHASGNACFSRWPLPAMYDAPPQQSG